ncbi:MAG: hypothetical protein J6R31_00230 [Rikenellaceae bacterium]|nr:hypothetical protein [Rikenellaceae bacterium]
MEKQGENKSNGFQRGLHQVAITRTKVEYDQCLTEVREVILTTEKRGCSVASFYSKRYGKIPLTVSEEQKIAEVFVKYGVTEWQGGENA